MSNRTLYVLSEEVTVSAFLIHLFSISTSQIFNFVIGRLGSGDHSVLQHKTLLEACDGTVLLQDWTAVLTKLSSLIFRTWVLFDGNCIAIFSWRRGNKTVCKHERESEDVCVCVCVSEVIKNGSVSPCCHPIHSRSRLHTLWHYLRPEELGFLTVDTGQMESGPFIVQSAALPPLCTAITQKNGLKLYSLYLDTVGFIWINRTVLPLEISLLRRWDDLLFLLADFSQMYFARSIIIILALLLRCRAVGNAGWFKTPKEQRVYVCYVLTSTEVTVKYTTCFTKWQTYCEL